MILGKLEGIDGGIEWIKVKELDDCDLFITKFIILCSKWDSTNDMRRPFADTLVGKMLNEAFFETAFSEEEKKRILMNDEIGCKVFVPTFREVECLKEKKAKIIPSIAKAVNYATRSGYSAWFLRDESRFSDTNWTCMDSNGKFDSIGGDFVLGGIVGVRPCILLKR